MTTVPIKCSVSKVVSHSSRIIYCNDKEPQSLTKNVIGVHTTDQFFSPRYPKRVLRKLHPYNNDKRTHENKNSINFFVERYQKATCPNSLEGSMAGEISGKPAEIFLERWFGNSYLHEYMK